MSYPPATLASLAKQLTLRFAQAGLEEPSREARRLLAAATDGQPADLIARPETMVSSADVARVEAWAARRAAQEPLSRILGERAFYGRTFRISPATLDPRPETETLVDAVLDYARAEQFADRPLRLIDVGTGSGCLILTLLAELPNATGVGTDVSAAALVIARDNAERFGLHDRVALRETRSLDGCSETFDVLVSNPPYIPSREIAGLEPSVRDHDPRLALDGGEDGLSVYREIAPRLPTVVPRGFAAFEVGVGQADDVAALLLASTAADRTMVRVHKDLAGHTRCVAVMTRS